MELPTILIDTREQIPLFVDEQGVVRNEYKTLAYFVKATVKYGDYTLKGFENIVSLERKTISDLRNSLMTNHNRFVKVLTAMGQMVRSGIVVEGTEQDFTGLLGMPDYRKFYRTLVSIQVHYGVPIYWVYHHEGAERFVFSYLTTFLKYYRKGEMICK